MQDDAQTCFCGTQLLGFLFGCVLGYIGSLLFRHQTIPVCLLMSFGISLGLKANEVKDPVDINIREFTVLMGITFSACLLLFSLLVILVDDDSSDLSLIVTSFVSSGIAAAFKVIRKFCTVIFREREELREVRNGVQYV
jgi:hypothetical protein